MTFPATPSPALRPIERPELITLVQTALRVGEERFARQACLSWLAAYPGDLPVSLLHARALLGINRPALALPILEKLCQIDPEYTEAVEALLSAQHRLIELDKPGQAFGAGRGERPTRPKGISTTLADNTLGWLLALEGNPPEQLGTVSAENFPQVKSAVAWSNALANSRRKLSARDTLSAEQILHDLLPKAPAVPLVASTHLRIVHARVQAGQSPVEALHSLAEHYRQRWPECLQAHLLLADAMMLGGLAAQGVELLHTVAARDVTAQVATRLWGQEHPYRALWPERLDLNLELPVPAAVGAVLGWNQLPAGEQIFRHNRPQQRTATQRTSRNGGAAGEKSNGSVPPWENPTPAYTAEIPESLQSVQAELERVGASIRRPELARSDGRFPVYVLLTTRRGLEGQFGERANEVQAGLRRLAAAADSRRDWSALVYIVDQGAAWRGTDGENPALSSLTSARPNDPWEIKLAIADLDKTLAASGERIGALLIAGGPAIVPYHRLPNPVDDADLEVPSDNPYGSLDENYFIPEWPVGRLPEQPPGGPHTLPNATTYLAELERLAESHHAAARTKAQPSWLEKLWTQLLSWLTRQSPSPVNPHLSSGVAAAVWRQAAVQVFRPIGDPRALRTSPPLQRSAGRNGNLSALTPDVELGYFNLHGLDDAPEWFGQREFTLEQASEEPTAGSEDYPVALHPSDVLQAGQAPQIVFSEACYGAQISERSATDAANSLSSMALAFLARGTQAFIGSTCTAYGAIRPPLIAADLLAQGFWNYLAKGLPAGEALRRAKIALARDMHVRQGYLDGEDQKTLLSFVLLGDPLAYPQGWRQQPRPVKRALHQPVEVNTVCERAHPEASEPVPDEVLAYVKNVVAHYLPGMQACQVSLSRPHQPGQGAYCPLSFPGAKPKLAGGGTAELTRQVITLSKQIGGAHPHRRYARLTLDANGKLVKLAVSR